MIIYHMIRVILSYCISIYKIFIDQTHLKARKYEKR